MDLNFQQLKGLHPVNVSGSDRWQIYYRLQELQIPCECDFNQPLKIRLTNPTAAFQLWNVYRQTTVSKPEQVEWLQRCWCLPSHCPKSS